MEEQKIKIEDESGDHQYFTMVPNYILNHSTATAQALYLQLKRLAGESGVAYPGWKYLMDKLSITRNTLRKEMQYLLEKGWIKYNGEKAVSTPGGMQKVKSYKIVNIWKLNIDYYESKGGQNKAPPEQRGVKIIPQGGSTRGVKIEHKEEPLEKELIKKREQTPASEMRAFIHSVETQNQKFQDLTSALSEKARLPEQMVARELKKFVNYWCELTKSGRKQRWELEKTFEVNRRLATWFSRINSFKQSAPQSRGVSTTF